MPHRLGRGYKSPSQKARVVTEGWGEKNFYCLNCSSPRLDRTRAGTPAHDFICPRCEARYELKSQRTPLRHRIADAAYSEMIKAIESRDRPHLFAIHYDPDRWLVRNLILIPRAVFTPSAIRRRNPTIIRATQRRWVGCDIILANIPPSARIQLVGEGRPISRRAARRKYRALKSLETLGLESRGWTLDVWNVVQKIEKREFSLAEAYAFAGELRKLHPANRNVEPKIRQQLQILRKKGFVEFLGRGRYRLRS